MSGRSLAKQPLNVWADREVLRDVASQRTLWQTGLTEQRAIVLS
ncbi:MAG: hypothetical protein ACEQSD_04860 [Flavobacteriales bacterium]